MNFFIWMYRLFLFVLVLVLVCACNINEYEAKRANRLVLREFEKTQAEKDSYVFQLESVRVEKGTTSRILGIFKFRSNVAVELAGSFSVNIETMKKSLVEYSPHYPFNYRMKNNKWEKPDPRFWCGTGVKYETLKANQTYKFQIYLDYFYDYKGLGAVKVSSFKSDIFSVDMIHEAIGRVDGGSELIKKNQLLQETFFGENKFENCLLKEKHVFDLRNYYRSGVAMPLEVHSYISKDDKYVLIYTKYIDPFSKGNKQTEKIVAYTNESNPKMQLAFVSNKTNGKTTNEGVLIFKDDTFDSEFVQYVERYTDVSFEKSVVFRKENNELPKYPIVDADSLHILGPKLFKNNIETISVVELEFNQDYFPLDFTYYCKPVFSCSKDKGGGRLMVLKGNIFDREIKWYFDGSGRFIKREHFKTKKSWDVE